MTMFFSTWNGPVYATARSPSSPPPKGPLSSQEILKAVAWRHDMTVAELLSPSRQQRYVRARWDAMYELKTTPRIGGIFRSLPEIGRQMGGLDHTTVLHGLRRREEEAAKAAAKREAVAA